MARSEREAEAEAEAGAASGVHDCTLVRSQGTATVSPVAARAAHSPRTESQLVFDGQQCTPSAHFCACNHIGRDILVTGGHHQTDSTRFNS